MWSPLAFARLLHVLKCSKMEIFFYHYLVKRKMYLCSRTWCSSPAPAQAPICPLCFLSRTQAACSPSVCLIACRSEHCPGLWKLGNLHRLWTPPDPSLLHPQWVHKQWMHGWHQQFHVNGDALQQTQRCLFFYPLSWFSFSFLALPCFTLNIWLNYIALKEVFDALYSQWGDVCFLTALEISAVKGVCVVSKSEFSIKSSS